MGKKQKIALYERTVENDIRYRGPFSYRHLQIFGWFSIVCLAAGLCVGIYMQAIDDVPGYIRTIYTVLTTIGDFSLPLFLFANFAIILDEKVSYKIQIFKFAGLSLMVAIGVMLVFNRYLNGILAAATGDRQVAGEIISTIMDYGTRSGGMRFNLFIDLFLCTLFMFFVNYEPTKYFVGKKKKYFRMMAVLPVLYEIGSLVLRILSSLGKITLPLFVYPFLTIKAPLSFVLFITLVLFIRRRRKLFFKKGKTEEEFRAFAGTNLNSFQFSRFASIAILITSILDLILVALLPAILLVLKEPMVTELAASPEEADMAVSAFNIVHSWGIGDNLMLLFIIPIILLFSYTRTHKSKLVDMAIPAGGIFLTVIVMIEGLYHVAVGFLSQYGAELVTSLSEL